MDVTSEELENPYGNHIRKYSILCTGSHKNYIQFATDMKLDDK